MTPEFKITAGGEDITQRLNNRLLGLVVTDEAGWVSDSLTITLDNRGEELTTPTRGERLSVSLGYKGSSLENMGDFIVDEVEHAFPPAQLIIRGRSANTFDGGIGDLKAPRFKSWHDTTYDKIANAIAGGHGLSTEVCAEIASIEIDHIDQTGESDIAFLNRIVEDAGGFVKVAGGKLIISEHDGFEIPPLVLKTQDITSWRCRIAERGKYGSVKARYYDRKAGEEKIITEGSGEPVFRLPFRYASATTAQRAARAKLERLEQGIHTLEICAIGNPIISTETPLAVVGVSTYVNGAWVAGSCTHRLDASGYTTTINATKRRP